MQYSSFIGDHVPCRYKALIEDSALKQLLFASEDRLKMKPEFMAEFRNRVAPKGNSKTTLEEELKANSKKKPSGSEDSPKQLSLCEVLRMINRGGKFTRAFRGWKVCTLFHDKPILYGLPDDPKARLRRSNSLYLTGYTSIDYPQSICRSPKMTHLHSHSSPLATRSSISGLNKWTPKTATKAQSCHTQNPTTTSDTNMPISRTRVLIAQTAPRPVTSSGTPPEKASRREVVRSASSSDQTSGNDKAINVEFQHWDDVDWYATNYREGYTYRKLKEKRPHSCATNTTTNSTTAQCGSPPMVTMANIICITSSPGNHAHQATPTKHHSIPALHTSPSKPSKCKSTSTTSATTTNNNSHQPTPGSKPTGVAGAKEMRIHHGNTKIFFPVRSEDLGQELVSVTKPMRWQVTQQQVHESCDPRLTVKNLSPTEVGIVCRVPQVTPKSSAPSIPSNTNGKFGGKSRDKPYPFQLHIAAASCPVRSTNKKPSKSVLGLI